MCTGAAALGLMTQNRAGRTFTPGHRQVTTKLETSRVSAIGVARLNSERLYLRQCRPQQHKMGISGADGVNEVVVGCCRGNPPFRHGFCQQGGQHEGQVSRTSP